MTVLLSTTKTRRESGNPLDLNPHIVSSSNQTTTPQFLHMTGPEKSVFVKVYKLVTGTWTVVYSGMMSVTDPGVPIGGFNAPLRFQCPSHDVASFSVTDTASNPNA